MKLKFSFILIFALGICSLAKSQGSFIVGELQDQTLVLTITEANFNIEMDSFISGRTYSNLELLTGMDSLSQYYYIKADALISSTTYPVIIVLKKDGTDILFEAATGCEMKCTWSGNCMGCDLEVIIKCQSLRCTCNLTDGSPGFGGCNSSMSFPD